MSAEIKKVIRDGKVAVLYSPQYGAGWFTWNSNCKECLFSPEVVAIIEAGEKPSDEICAALFGDEFYSGGSRDLQIHWLTEGTPFRVNEYDGFETIQTNDDLFIIA